MAEQLLSTLDSMNLNEKGNKILVTGFAAIGAYYLSKRCYSFVSGVFQYCLLPRLDLKTRYGGGWALVTGASDGIGKGYCKTLAAAGFDIILMARDQGKMETVAAELREAY